MNTKKNKTSQKLFKNISSGMRYMFNTRFLDWSDEEVARYAVLRAIEWVAWPSFISIGLGPILLVLVAPIKLAIAVIVVDVIWYFISPVIYIYWLSNLGIYLNRLKWVSAPVMALVFLASHNLWLAVIALLWPFIGLILSFPGAFIGGAAAFQNTGKVEERIYAKIEQLRRS